jgi:glycosyltransferase involved in cell wall biosynthesis
MSTPTVTVYVLCHNYGRYLSQAIESVFLQSRTDWELIVIDDGSEDDSLAVAESLRDVHPDRVRIVSHERARGLQKSANEAIRLARGKYVMRLDADDYLDENALLVLTHHLDADEEAALVYPGYVYVDADGHYLGVEQRWRIGDETVVLDQPAHGACTMVRKRVLKAIGGYDEVNDRQDGHELWLKVVNRYKVLQIHTPLFYYRQHGAGLSDDRSELLAARARIKRALVDRNAGPVAPTVVAVVGAKNTYEDMPNVVLRPIAGRPLIDYTLDAALTVETLDRVVVSTDDQAVVDYCAEQYPAIAARLRPPALSAPTASETDLLLESVRHLENQDLWPDIVVSLGVHTPLRTAEHVQKAIDTLLLYDIDTVISVHEDQDLYYTHGERGLDPLNPGMHRQVRVEREALFAGNGAVRALWRDVLDQPEAFRPRVGHILMPRPTGVHIKSPQDAWLAEQLLKERESGHPLLPDSWRA